MLKDKNKPITDETTCMHCLKEDALNKFVRIKIGSLGYGSQFDNDGTKLILCPDCYSKTNPLWWELNTVSTEECGILFDVYEYEYEIIKFVEEFPLSGQERFFNSLSDSPMVSAEDWINNCLKHLELYGKENATDECEDALSETIEELFDVRQVLCEALTELFVPREFKKEDLKVIYDYDEEHYVFPTTMGSTFIRELGNISSLIEDSK